MVSLRITDPSICRVGYLTAAATITGGLHVPLPYLDPTVSSSLRSVLVLGGSSAVGAASIQLLRLALPSATILATSSAKHHAHLVSLGATKCFERSAQDDTSAIKAATPGGSGVDAILDAVTAAASQPAVFTALNPTEGISSTAMNAVQIFDTKGGMAAMPSLTRLVESGNYKLPVKVEVLGKGFDAIEQSLEKLKEGISGAKYVVSL